MNTTHPYPCLPFRLAAVTLAVWMTAAGVGLAQKMSGASQLRRTVDPCERSAFGSVVLQQDGVKQAVSVLVRNLGQESFSIFLGTGPGLDTNSLVGLVGPLQRVNLPKGIWQRLMEGIGGPPAEFASFEIDDLGDLTGGILLIARPGSDLLVGVTNIVGSTTNIIFGLPLPYPDITNTVAAVLWAPLPALFPNPNLTSFTRKAVLRRADTPFPDPKVSGEVTSRYQGAQGRSLLDIRASGLFAGQVYTVYVADAVEPTVFIPAGPLKLSKSGTSGRFLRDTKYGDPLPQQAGTVAELAGRPLFIADEFGTVYLEGTIP